MTEKSLAGFNRSATFYGSYDAGSEVFADVGSAEVELDVQAQQLLLYPTEECFVKLNASEKEIYVPKGSWTPVSVLVDSFTIRATAACTVHWQGWVL